MNKRILSLALCAFLCVGLLGCTYPVPEVYWATNPTTETVTEPTVPETTQETTLPNPYENLHSGIRADGSFNEGTVFVGDSLTYGLIYFHLSSHNLLGDARYMAIAGIPLNVYFSDWFVLGSSHGDKNGQIYTPEFYGMSYAEAIEAIGGEATAIYMMLGTNGSDFTPLEEYITVLDHMLENCPNATIYLQTVPISRSSVVFYDTINGIIRQAAQHYADRGETRVVLLDTFTVFEKKHLVPDGIHLTEEGQAVWYQFLVDRTTELGIPE